MPQLTLCEFDPVDQLPLGFSELNYEITVTYNPQLYTVIAACEALESTMDTINQWLVKEFENLESVSYVVEYQRNRYPHLHACVSSTRALDVSRRANIIKGIQRMFGRCTFKPVIDADKYYEYMCKDLYNNYLLTNKKHYYQFILTN